MVLDVWPRFLAGMPETFVATVCGGVGFWGACVGVGYVNRVSVVIASGKRPVTFRTRKLRLTAPMVLRGGPRGRVGHRRTIIGKPPEY